VINFDQYKLSLTVRVLESPKSLRKIFSQITTFRLLSTILISVGLGACSSQPQVADTKMDPPSPQPAPSLKIDSAPVSLRGISASTIRPEPHDIIASSNESTEQTNLPSWSALIAPEKDNLWSDIANNLGFASANSHLRVDQRLEFYTDNQPYFDKVTGRAALYMPHIVAQLKKRGLPLELALLPIIESAYNPFAYSSSAAAGLWQFIPSTAEYMNLEQSWWYDGRKDIIASTDAALRYLDYLHGRFDGDWLLVLAAYNGGEGRLRRAIRRNQAKGLPVDYWSLRHSAETNGYVPQFLALAKIITSPESYGIKLQSIKSTPNFDVVAIEQSIDIPQAARLANISLDKIYQLNPGFQRRATPPSGSTSLLLPVSAIPLFKERVTKAPPSSWQAIEQYVVQSGDTLSEIARSKHVELDTLSKMNRLTSYRINKGQILRIPGTGISSQVALPDFIGIAANYRIRHGDTLSGIANKYRVSLDSVLAWNHLSKSTILKPGQRIIIRSVTSPQLVSGASGPKISYQVKRGDSLYRISQQFKIAMRDIVKWNNLKNKNRLLPGQTLVLYLQSGKTDKSA
jgi:membrane-bound lytic murein transglycosylase D